MRTMLAATAAVLILAGAARAAPSADAQMNDDARAVSTATDAFNRMGYPAVAQREAALSAIIARMPHPFQALVVRGDTATYYVSSRDACLLAMAEAARGANAPRNAECVVAPYAGAARLLGLYYNENHRGAEALAVLTAGLEAAPDDPVLLSEAGIANNLLQRWPQSLAMYDRGIATPGLGDVDLARMYRGRGFALTELNRLDEAEAAYRKSLQLEPGHGGAQAEIRYIQGLRGGAAATGSDIYSGEEARQGPPTPAATPKPE